MHFNSQNVEKDEFDTHVSKGEDTKQTWQILKAFSLRKPPLKVCLQIFKIQERAGGGTAGLGPAPGLRPCLEGCVSRPSLGLSRGTHDVPEG